MSTKARAPKNTSQSRMLKALRYRGLFARVARTIGVSRQHVGRVARGERISRRVEEELRREIQRIEAAA